MDYTFPRILVPLSETYGTTITNTTSQLTVPDQAFAAHIFNDDQPVRYIYDAATDGDPVAGTGGGMLLPADTDRWFYGHSVLEALKFIKDGATDAFLNVAFFRMD